MFGELQEITSKDNIARLEIMYDLKNNKMYVYTVKKSVNFGRESRYKFIEISINSQDNIKVKISEGEPEKMYEQFQKIKKQDILIKLKNLSIYDYSNNEEIEIGIYTNNTPKISVVYTYDIIESNSLITSKEDVIKLKNKLDKIINEKFRNVKNYLNKIILFLDNELIVDRLKDFMYISLQLDKNISKKVLFDFIKENIKDNEIKEIMINDKKEFRELFILRSSNYSFLKFNEKLKKFIPKDKDYIKLEVLGFAVHTNKDGNISLIRIGDSKKYKRNFNGVINEHVKNMFFSIFKNKSRDLFRTTIQIEKFNRSGSLKDFILIFKYKFNKENINIGNYIDSLFNDFTDLSGIQLNIGKNKKRIHIDYPSIISDTLTTLIFYRC